MEPRGWLRLAPGPGLSKPIAVRAGSARRSGFTGCGPASARSSRGLAAGSTRPPPRRAAAVRGGSVRRREDVRPAGWVLLSGSCFIV